MPLSQLMKDTMAPPVSLKARNMRVASEKPAPNKILSASKQGFKSAEYVAESDLEDDVEKEDEASVPPVSAKKLPILPPSISRKSNGKTTHKKAASPSSGKEHVTQDDGGSIAPVSAKKMPVLPHGLKAKAKGKSTSNEAVISSSEPEVESDDDNEGGPAEEARSGTEESEEEKDSEDDSEREAEMEDERSSSDDGGKGKANEMEVDARLPPLHQKAKAASSQKPPLKSTSTKPPKPGGAPKPAQEEPTHVAAPIPPVPFVPPKGFQLTPVDEEPVVSQLFKKSRLQGKQIWYITAPSSIPISTIQNLSLEKVRSHSKAFISEDKDYAFFEDASQDKSRMKLVLPKASAEGYQLSSTPINQIINIRQIHNLSIPDLAPSIVPEKEAPKVQPEGLKMRFHPIGFESISSRSTFMPPVKYSAPLLSPKRRIEEVGEDGGRSSELVEETPRKKRKHSHDDEKGTPKSERRKEKHRDREKKSKKISLG